MREKLRENRRILLIITIVVAIVTVASFIVYIIARNTNGQIILVDMELAGSDEMVAKIDVSFLSGRLAKGRDGLNYYLAGDEEHLFLYATKSELNKQLKDILDYSYSIISTKPNSYRVIGLTKEIPDELKKIALDAYNKMFSDKAIEEAEFEKYIGDYYLEECKLFDETENIKFIILIICASVMILFTVFLILSFLI